MLTINYTKKHALSKELDEVHKDLINKYEIEQEGAKDVIQAKRMEQYLRKFKAIGDRFQNDFTNTTIQTLLTDEAIQEVTDELSPKLKTGKSADVNSIFRWTHAMGRKYQGNADDIFELELFTLLETAADKAIQRAENDTSHYDLGVQAIGNLSVNLPQEFIRALDEGGGNDLIQKTTKENEIIKKPEFRPGKADIKGYSATVTTEIKPEWQEFISIFTGVTLSVKNYSSKSSFSKIHLGNTMPQKAIMSSLGALSYPSNLASHVYYHMTGNVTESGTHIIHLRFAYELAGGKLIDQDGNDIEQVDFFVYNDPSSSNIWVRSTKQMISDFMKQKNKIGDPLHDDIMILKSDFY